MCKVHPFGCRSTLLAMCNAAQVDDAVLYPEAARGAFRITVGPHAIPTVARKPVMMKPAPFTAQKATQIDISALSCRNRACKFRRLKEA